MNTQSQTSITQLENLFRMACEWEYKAQNTRPGDLLDGKVITEAELEQGLRDVQRFRHATRIALQNAGYTAAQINQIVLDSTRALEGK